MQGTARPATFRPSFLEPCLPVRTGLSALLGRADARNGDLGEHVGGGGGALGGARRAGLELRGAERAPERAGRFPDRDVDERRAAGGAAVELGRDEAGLLLHEGGVVSPDLQEALRIAGRQVELVNEHDRALVALQLLDVGDLVVHLTQSHRSLLLQPAQPTIPVTAADLPADREACFWRRSGSAWRAAAGGWSMSSRVWS